MRASLATAILFALVLGGCERGCLAAWLADHGAGGDGPRGPSSRDAGHGLDLGGTDCSDGLARCVGGRVEVSRAAHLPHPCAPSGAPPEQRRACDCPWDVVSTCAAGCSLERFEVVAAADAASVQLCRPELPVARPFGPADAPLSGVCSEEGFACIDGVVRACDAPGAPPRPIAKCLDGCATTVGVADGTTGSLGTGGGPAEILCRRGHPERR